MQPQQQNVDAEQVIASLQRQLTQANFRIAILEAQLQQGAQVQVAEEATESPNSEEGPQIS